MEIGATFRTAFVMTEWGIIAYVALINLIYLFLLLLGFFTLRHHRATPGRTEHDALIKSSLLPGISVIAPAYNEEATIRESVRSFLSLEYPQLTVIVVNDGSSDGTLDALIDEFRLYRSSRLPSAELATQPIHAIYESRDPIALVVVDKQNGGKSDALNAGLLVARTPLVAAVDADSLLETRALYTLVRPFLDDPDGTLATGGIVRVVNGCEVRHGQVQRVAAPDRLVPLIQSVEYLRAFLGGRVAFSFLNALLLISGAFGLFRREIVLAVGGFSTSTVGEDLELVLRLHRYGRTRATPYQILFVPDPVCWTEVPETLSVLRRQRNRWQRGTLECLTTHWRMLLNPRYGAVGLFALPYFALFELLGPVVELAGYLFTTVGFVTGLISWEVALLFFVVSVVFGMVLAVGAVLLEDISVRRYPDPADVLKLLGAAVVENLGFRQLLTVWRAKGLVDGLRGHTGWGAMERRGFRAATPS